MNLGPCRACGTNDQVMAQVSDPFADACYHLCRACLGTLYGAMHRQLLAQLNARPAEEAPQ